uniref:Major facilitator superfamily (MFS) profile domain-containing protein n=1 Tax=Panagrolaimus davidi TaxID=227884 RepID=A0A914QK01_9BILA
MPLAGFSCSSIFGWQGIYYLFGFLTLIVCAVFYYIYTDTPRKHKYVSPRELYKIESCKSIVEDRMKPKIPYYKMITDISVIGTLIIAIGDFVCFNIFMLFAPVYLNKVLGLDVKQTGVSSAIPYIGSLIVKVFIGPLSDKLTSISMLNNVRIFMCISQTGVVEAVKDWSGRGSVTDWSDSGSGTDGMEW